MCQDCWQEYGAPTVMPVGGGEAVALIKEIYAHPEGAAGGPLHVHLDDWNLDGVWTRYEPGSPDELIGISARLCLLMNAWTVRERAAVLAAAAGWTSHGAIDA